LQQKLAASFKGMEDFSMIHQIGTGLQKEDEHNAKNH